MFSISSLHHFDCDGCSALTSPPYAVCKQGVKAVRKYYYDLKIEAGSNQHLIPVTVIGKTKAGKTSLVKSVQRNKRVLTERTSAESKLDASTKVFKVCEAEINKKSKLLFVDYGGQSIYHFSYQLTFKTQCVPLLVINIEEFDRLATQNGEEVACQDVRMEWLSHLYISCPRLCRPVVVLTHRDKLTDECFDRRKQQLVEETEKLRCRIIESEKCAAPSSSPVFLMTSFADTSEPLFTPSRILDFSVSSTEADIETLKQLLTTGGAPLMTEIPGSWYRMLLDMTEETNQSYIKLSEIVKKYPQDEEHVTLQYLHDIGRTMWFRKMEKLKNFVFHRLEVLTTLIEILYSHTQEEAWTKRLHEFLPFRHLGKTIELYKYQEMIDTFNTTGVMEAPLLINLLERESRLPADVAVEVLKTFHLVHLCGSGSSAQTYNQKYIIPYFATRTITAPNFHSNLIPLKVDLLFHGLPVPNYVFTLITASYLDINSNPFCVSEVGGNGATVVQGNGIVNFLIHSFAKKQVTLITLTPTKKIDEAWTGQLRSLTKLVSELQTTWKAVRYESIFYCSHCLLTDKQAPATTVGPDWFQYSSEGKESFPSIGCYTGDEYFICKKEVGNPDCQSVPRPLMFPCRYILFVLYCIRVGLIGVSVAEV